MVAEWFDNIMESVNDTMDEVVIRSPLPKRTSPLIKNRDERLLRFFPYFILICIGFFLIGMVTCEERTLTKGIEVLCLSFVLCFMILGIPCSLMMPHGKFSFLTVAAMTFLMTTVLWITMTLIDFNYFGDAIADIFAFIGIRVDEMEYHIMGFVWTYLIMLFTPIGVISVISAYLCKYFPRIFIGMDKNAKEGIRGPAEGFFKIPEIVDVKKVIMEPSKIDHHFNLKGAAFMTTYLFILGLLISSYVFINPYFLDVMSTRTMLAIMLMLSMFTAALLLPWLIVRQLGVKVTSDAPRDYDLWIGAKNRLFTTFMALSAFMMMFVISIYMGNAVWDIITRYIQFLVPLAVTSFIYGFIYTNNFETNDHDVILERFEKGECRKP